MAGISFNPGNHIFIRVSAAGLFVSCSPPPLLLFSLLYFEKLRTSATSRRQRRQLATVLAFENSNCKSTDHRIFVVRVQNTKFSYMSSHAVLQNAACNSLIAHGTLASDPVPRASKLTCHVLLPSANANETRPRTFCRYDESNSTTSTELVHSYVSTNCSWCQHSSYL